MELWVVHNDGCGMSVFADEGRAYAEACRMTVRSMVGDMDNFPQMFECVFDGTAHPRNFEELLGCTVARVQQQLTPVQLRTSEVQAEWFRDLFLKLSAEAEKDGVSRSRRFLRALQVLGGVSAEVVLVQPDRVHLDKERPQR